MPSDASLRIVIDTNVFVSQILKPDSVPARAVAKAIRFATLLISDATYAELHAVLLRHKFDPYISLFRRQKLLVELREFAFIVAIPAPIRACRDPRDDKFLEVAVHGRADLIVTGDADLLALHPFHGIAILTPAAYLEME